MNPPPASPPTDPERLRAIARFGWDDLNAIADRIEALTAEVAGLRRPPVGGVPKMNDGDDELERLARLGADDARRLREAVLFIPSQFNRIADRIDSTIADARSRLAASEAQVAALDSTIADARSRLAASEAQVAALVAQRFDLFTRVEVAESQAQEADAANGEWHKQSVAQQSVIDGLRVQMARQVDMVGLGRLDADAQRAQVARDRDEIEGLRGRLAEVEAGLVEAEARVVELRERATLPEGAELVTLEAAVAGEMELWQNGRVTDGDLEWWVPWGNYNPEPYKGSSTVVVARRWPQPVTPPTVKIRAVDIRKSVLPAGEVVDHYGNRERLQRSLILVKHSFANGELNQVCLQVAGTGTCLWFRPDDRIEVLVEPTDGPEAQR